MAGRIEVLPFFKHAPVMDRCDKQFLLRLGMALILIVLTSIIHTNSCVNTDRDKIPRVSTRAIPRHLYVIGVRPAIPE